MQYLYDTYLIYTAFKIEPEGPEIMRMVPPSSGSHGPPLTRWGTWLQPLSSKKALMNKGRKLEVKQADLLLDHGPYVGMVTSGSHVSSVIDLSLHFIPSLASQC